MANFKDRQLYFMVRSLVVYQPRENSCVLQISEEVILNFIKHENL